MKPTQKPVVPAAAPSVSETVIETNTSTIQIETNTSLMETRPGPVESVTVEGPGGVVIETFVGIQSGVNWATPAADAVVEPEA